MPPVRDSEKGDDKVKGSSLYDQKGLLFGKAISHELVKCGINFSDETLNNKTEKYFL